MKRILIVMFAFTELAFSITASALQCPSFPEQVAKDWQVEVNATVTRIGPIKGGELATKVQSATQDLLGRLPEGSRLYLEQMMYAAYCSALKDDRSLSEAEKGQRLMEYNREVRRVLQAPQTPSRVWPEKFDEVRTAQLLLSEVDDELLVTVNLTVRSFLRWFSSNRAEPRINLR